MIRNMVKHLQCSGQNEANELKQTKEKKSICERLRSLRGRHSNKHDMSRKVDVLELEWSNSPKSRLRRNGFDIPVYG